jgi:hypothetical protein
MNDDQNDMPAKPDKLRAALSRLEVRKIIVPPQVDDAVLRAARERLEVVAREVCAEKKATSVPPESFWAELRAWVQGVFAVRHWAAWGGVAALIVAVGGLVWLGEHPRSAARPEDLNGDGAVDMLDAFALARELQREPASHPQLDLNGDGAVDQRDVQDLAARAVRLEPGGRS